MRGLRAVAWLLTGISATCWGLASAVHAPRRPRGANTVPPFNGREDHVLIYQYGKVGSEAMQGGIQKVLVPPSRVGYTPTMRKSYPRAQKVHSREIAAHALSQVPAGRTVWIITMTRMRFFRDVSAYFQNINKWLNRSAVLQANMSVLHEHFRSLYHGPGFQDNWFSSVFYNVTGVNMLYYADRLAGHNNSSNGDHIFIRKRWRGAQLDLNIILLKFEHIADWEHTLQPYFPGIRIGKKNVGQRKWYGHVYAEFLNTYKYSRREIDALCKGETTRFYTEAERRDLAPQCDPSQATAKVRRTFVIDESGRVRLNTTNLSLTVADLNEEGDDGDDGDALDE